MTRETATPPPAGSGFDSRSTAAVETHLPAHNETVGDSTLEADPRWQAVLRIVASKNFARASRLSAFLLYISERAIEGHMEEITEQQIGVRVFGRPSHYNPGDDNIVRGTARLLRQRLDRYYQEEGTLETVRVVVPRGAYVPVFERVAEAHAGLLPSEPAMLETVPSVLVAQPQAQPSRRTLPLLVSFALGALLVVALQYAVKRPPAVPSPSAQLWHVLFSPNKRTLIVAGDAGVNMFDNLAKRQVDVNEYSQRTYLSSPYAQTPSGYDWAPLATRGYVGVQDLKFVASLVRLPEVRDNPRVFVHYAREIRPEDLMDANAILLGSPAFNPWIQLFDKNLDFSMSYNGVENSITVVNRKPEPGEKPSYKWTWNDPAHAYALIALTDNLNSSGKVLLIEGTTVMPIGAASDLLLKQGQMSEILSRASNPDGSLKSFEVLLETSLVGNSSTQPTVLAVHIHN